MRDDEHEVSCGEVHMSSVSFIQSHQSELSCVVSIKVVNLINEITLGIHGEEARVFISPQFYKHSVLIHTNVILL